jgi:hypothetical protein
MTPAQRFQWVFAMLMGTAMVFGVTFAVTAFAAFSVGVCHVDGYRHGIRGYFCGHRVQHRFR